MSVTIDMPGVLVQLTTPIRILVVDDFEPYRCSTCSMIQQRLDLTILAEVQDGLEAVRQAEMLQPDIILLDIGLPLLNGIEAARQITKVASSARIIFLTQESSAEVVHEALALGAWGYVIKSKAGTELLAAVDAVAQGGTFVSAGLNGYSTADLIEPESKEISH
jgi:DNA-binding NarL/FixJ family response regulator